VQGFFDYSLQRLVVGDYFVWYFRIGSDSIPVSNLLQSYRTHWPHNTECYGVFATRLGSQHKRDKGPFPKMPDGKWKAVPGPSFDETRAVMEGICARGKPEPII
jgi:hypothetical protein